jgi:hypothetical protein
MVCPECVVAYRSGFTECADCHVPLVEPPIEGAPRSPGESTPEPVTVFESGDPGLVALAPSILDSAGLPFVMKGEDPLGGGALPGIVNPAGGPVQFQVSPAGPSSSR